jgi:hypothetical protein
MSTKNKDRKVEQEFENDSHIGKKKRAVEQDHRPRNFKQSLEMYSDEEDKDDVLKYVRYIK